MKELANDGSLWLLSIDCSYNRREEDMIMNTGEVMICWVILFMKRNDTRSLPKSGGGKS
jgi:hypothetical protein